MHDAYSAIGADIQKPKKDVRMVPVVSKEAIQNAEKLSREDYKAVKHMSKAELVEYLARIYRRGYEAGREAGRKEAKEADNG